MAVERGRKNWDRTNPLRYAFVDKVRRRNKVSVNTVGSEGGSSGLATIRTGHDRAGQDGMGPFLYRMGWVYANFIVSGIEFFSISS